MNSVCKEGHFWCTWLGIFHLLWLILCPSVCADWVSAHVCYLTSSPFSPPGRHILKSRCGWSHACSERLRETEHNSDFNTTESHIIHTARPPTHQTNHSGHMNDFHPSLKSISSFLVIYLWPLVFRVMQWELKTEASPSFVDSLIRVLNMQRWVLNSGQASRSLQIAVWTY